MTDRERAFLRAIIDNPEDDLSRLIFADWLEEHGQGERAEFIRVQIARALYEKSLEGEFLVLPESPKGQRMEAYRRRERELIPHLHETDWPFGVKEQSWMPKGVLALCQEQDERGVAHRMVEWRRGFVEGLTCPWPDFARHADQIREQTPLGEVTLTTWPLCLPVFSDFAPWKLALVGTCGLTDDAGGSFVRPTESVVVALLEKHYSGIAFTLPRERWDIVPVNATDRIDNLVVNYTYADRDRRILYGDPDAPQQFLGIINARGSQ